VKLLFDENLSPRLVQALGSDYPGSAHVRLLACGARQTARSGNWPGNRNGKTEDSKKSDAEIAEVLRKEEPELYRMIPEELVREPEPQRIWHWRLRKMEVLGDNIVVVERKSARYIRGAVESVDYDLAILNAVIDAFLVGIFGRPEAVAN
ncbi:MAG TPA: hypothetical protein VLT62_17415, partial [Candidatus Methylomirabilis sp.]|nr:hypothetical protein [Candidatus Methylomirabilis sp.]